MKKTKKSSTPRSVPIRERLYSILAWKIGGWNASCGTSMGRLREWDEHFNKDDEKLIQYLLNRHENDVTYDLRKENDELKAKLYDAQVKHQIRERHN